MRNPIVPFTAVLAISSGAFAQARVIITEIMYNPASTEQKGEAEWVEIANAGNEAIEIKDWRLKDEDRTKWSRFSCTLAPGGVAVLINADAVTEAQFREAWDEPHVEGSEAPNLNYQVIPVKWGGLANTPGPDNEILQLVNEKDEVICEVKQAGEWPKVKGAGGPSIYLADPTTTDLSNGALWRISEDGKDGARHNKTTEVFDKTDCGSPGFVAKLSAAGGVPPPQTEPVKPKDQPKDDTIDY